MYFILICFIFFSQILCDSISFITSKEKTDLEISRLVKALDSTKTLGGKKALEGLLNPTQDHCVTHQRQSVIQRLLEDEDLYNKLETWLLEISSYEAKSLAYMERKSDLLEFQSESLYFQPLLNSNFFQKIANFCNKSSLILEGSILKQLWNSFMPIIFQLGAAGVAFKYNQWLFEQTDHFEYWEGIKLGLEKPIKDHSWAPYITQELVESGNSEKVSHPFYLKSLLNGSLRDRFEIFKRGMTGRICFNKNWSLPAGHAPILPPFAFLTALVVTACSDIVQGVSIASAWKQFSLQYATIQELKKQLYYLKHYLNSIAQLSNTFDTTNVTQEMLTPLSLHDQSKLNELRLHLSKGTFSSPDGSFYRRGLVLWLHKRMSHYFNVIDQCKNQVGTIDAYMSIVRCIKQLEAHNRPVCFASFTDQTNICTITNGWILTTPDLCVQNTIELGGDKPRAIILSGPHGCGKSTILTLLGHTAILAHSIGIGFASSVTISRLKGLRTSFSTDAIPQQGLSTFMAAQQSIQQIEQFINNLDPSQTGMILLSEPYKGTVEAEAAYRINLFCTNYFLKHPSTLMALETHVAEPMMLAQKFPDQFANKQMLINILDTGEFERTFLMTDGTAQWWFENSQLRSRYINWIDELVRSRLR